jgi:hypothetical protein
MERPVAVGLTIANNGFAVGMNSASLRDFAKMTGTPEKELVTDLTMRPIGRRGFPVLICYVYTNPMLCP